MSAPRRRVPEWIFAITSIPYGVAGGFIGFAMPYLLRKAGISVEDIGWFGSATFIPTVLQFLYAPVVDLGPRRRSWLVILSLIGALCFGAALMLPLPSHASAFLVLIVLGQLFVGLVGSCNGAIMATVLPDELRGRAGGFYNAGNLGGGALGAGVTMQLAQTCTPLVVALVTGLMIVVPSLVALAIPEPAPARRSAFDLFGSMVRDVVRTTRARSGWTGILLCLSPVGTAALMNQFSALGVDYHASDRMVTFVNGYLSGLVTAVGALGGGYICDRMNRRNAYLLSGALTAVCALAMMSAGLSPTVYAVGVTSYLLVAGFCYAAFSAVVLETVGNAAAGAATEYTLFTSAGNAAIAYTGFFDTRFHARYGPAGLLTVDAALNLAGIFVLFFLFRFLARRPTTAPSHG